MKSSQKINIRGRIRELVVGGDPLKLPRPNYVPSVVRVTATSIKADTGRKFSVAATDKQIIVTRLS